MSGPDSPPPPEAPSPEEIARALDRRLEEERTQRFFADLYRHVPTTPLTWTFLGLNVLVFVVMLVCGVHPFEPSSETLLRWGADFAPRTRAGQWWRLLSATFLHGGGLHLLVNMYCLKVLGPLVERLLGRAGFAVTYLASGVAGSLASDALGPAVVSVGASGSIFGLLGATLAYALHVPKEAFPATARRRLRNVAIQNIAINLLIGLSISRINNWAHLGGLVGGFACAYALSWPPAEPHVSLRPRRAARVAVVALLATAACAWALRLDDLEGAIDRSGRAEEQVSARFAALKAEAVAGRLGAAAFADRVEKEILPLLVEDHRAAEALDRVHRDSKEPLAALRKYTAGREAWGRRLVGWARDIHAKDDASFAAWRALVAEAVQNGATAPPPPPMLWDRARQEMEAPAPKPDGGR